MKLSSIKKIRGQGMSEYLIIVALLAVAGITTFSLLSGTARNQVAAIATEISGGDGGDQISSAASNAQDATTEGGTDRGMGKFDSDRF